MRDQDVFILADQTLKQVVDQIRDDQWMMTMPPEFAMRDPARNVTLREVINYHAYEDAWVPDMLAGRTMEDAGTTKFDGDLLGADPRGQFAALVDTACQAVRAVEDLDRTVHCSFGDFTTREYLWQITSFRGLRAHDLAQVIGADSRLPDDLVQGLWDQLSPIAEEWRGIGVFGPKVDVPADADLHAQLLGLTGRQP